MKSKSNLVRRKDGSYILKHKTSKAKKGDCTECKQNPKDSRMGLTYRYKKDDMLRVKHHMEETLMYYSSLKSMTPKWCSTCNALIDYEVEVDYEKSN